MPILLMLIPLTLILLIFRRSRAETKRVQGSVCLVKYVDDEAIFVNDDADSSPGDDRVDDAEHIDDAEQAF